jgi:hypothetical protein
LRRALFVLGWSVFFRSTVNKRTKKSLERRKCSAHVLPAKLSGFARDLLEPARKTIRFFSLAGAERRFAGRDAALAASRSELVLKKLDRLFR